MLECVLQFGLECVLQCVLQCGLQCGLQCVLQCVAVCVAVSCHGRQGDTIHPDAARVNSTDSSVSAT